MVILSSATLTSNCFNTVLSLIYYGEMVILANMDVIYYRTLLDELLSFWNILDSWDCSSSDTPDDI